MAYLQAIEVMSAHLATAFLLTGKIREGWRQETGEREPVSLSAPPFWEEAMKTLFDVAERDEIVGRLGTLRADSPRQWGRMNLGQMLCHCAVALESGTGDRPMKQKLIGKILMPFFRSSILGQKEFKRNSPTDPEFVITDERDFAAERNRLIALVQRFAAAGPSAAARNTHAFFGRMTGEEWGELMYKHIDHHLRQFDA